MNAIEVLGTGGPIAGIAVIVGYVLSYLLRKRSSETGVVEATKQTLGIMSKQQEQLAATAERLYTENEDLRARLRLKDEQIGALQLQSLDQSEKHRDLAEHVARLQAENQAMRERLQRLEEQT